MAEETEKTGRGRKNDQKMKPYLVYEYLMRHSDANHVVTGKDIVEYLQECGITAERRSIYRDIEEINKAILLTTSDRYEQLKAETIEEAEELLKDEKEKTIVYDKNKKGFYVRKRHYKLEDIQALAECIYSSKFLDEKRAKRLVNVICDLVSEHNAEGLKRDVIQLDRGKSDSVSNYDTLKKISFAMRRKRINNVAHTPEKIKFKYMSYTIQNGIRRTERRKGEWYVVSPYKLLISDGNYYLMGYDDKMQKIVTYRVDRMKDLELTGEPRSGADEYDEIIMETYLQEHFGMYHGEREYIKIRALNTLLDTFVDRFGTRDVIYAKDDDSHFTATVRVAVSSQFYGWLCGLGNKVKIISPEPIVEDFKQYLDKMRGIYD
jgi:predicted DNA-binding transcriptional regulator YafY